MKIRINSQLICLLCRKNNFDISNLLNSLILKHTQKTITENKDGSEKDDDELARERFKNNQRALSRFIITITWAFVAYSSTCNFEKFNDHIESKLFLLFSLILMTFAFLTEILSMMASEESAKKKLEKEDFEAYLFNEIVEIMNKHRNKFFLWGIICIILSIFFKV